MNKNLSIKENLDIYLEDFCLNKKTYEIYHFMEEIIADLTQYVNNKKYSVKYKYVAKKLYQKIFRNNLATAGPCRYLFFS